MKHFILAVLIGAASSFALANEKGNGGDAIVCRNAEGKIKSAELLDYFEAREYRKLPVSFDSSSSNEGYIRSVLEKLQSFDRYKFTKDIMLEASELLDALETFRARGEAISDEYRFSSQNLLDIPDSQHLIVPKNCSIEQFVIRVKRRVQEDPKFLIQSEILNALTDRDLRGIVLHEVIYRVFIENMNAQDSRAARYFHQKVVEKTLNELTFVNYLELLHDLKMEYILNRMDKGEIRAILPRYEVLPEGEIKMWVRNGETYEIVLNADASFNRVKTNDLGKFSIRYTFESSGGRYARSCYERMKGQAYGGYFASFDQTQVAQNHFIERNSVHLTHFTDFHDATYQLGKVSVATEYERATGVTRRCVAPDTSIRLEIGNVTNLYRTGSIIEGAKWKKDFQVSIDGNMELLIVEI
jgi:hypothetical protein